MVKWQWKRKYFNKAMLIQPRTGANKIPEENYLKKHTIHLA